MLAAEMRFRYGHELQSNPTKVAIFIFCQKALKTGVIKRLNLKNDEDCWCRISLICCYIFGFFFDVIS